MENHKIRAKRFVTVAEYQRMHGLGYATVMHMIKTGQVKAIETESGKYRVDTQSDYDGLKGLIDKTDETQRILKALCKQFNTAI